MSDADDLFVDDGDRLDFTEWLDTLDVKPWQRRVLADAQRVDRIDPRPGYRNGRPNGGDEVTFAFGERVSAVVDAARRVTAKYATPVDLDTLRSAVAALDQRDVGDTSHTEGPL
jgi:hypothetical protein